MRVSTPRALLALLVFGGLLVALSRPIGSAPALGTLLDPSRGVWAIGRGAQFPVGPVRIASLAGPVRIVYDDRAVPHIFASSVEDAIRALGFVVARDRLVQLEVQTLAASGRLTEIAGARALPLDQETRRLGLPRNAERIMRTSAAGSAERRLAAAYADGVNAWIDGMRPADFPLELRLLGQRHPARWEPVNTAHLIDRMMWTLASFAPERDRALAASRVGAAAAASLFPEHSPIQEPIQPNGQHAPVFEPVRIVAPGAPDSSAMLLAAAFTHAAPATSALLADGGTDERPSYASNNWAVAPSRSASHHALLAGDPHLELTLPSIWYEAHLVVPGKLDVYGVTIPGAPGILIGFTRDIAWSNTNTGADVMDFYTETVDDTDHPTRYRLDGTWRPLEVRVEAYHGRRGEIIATDTVRYTHRGPMHREGNRWLSMRWTALEEGAVAEAYEQLAQSKSTREALDLLAAGFRAPAQNFVVADRSGTIGIRSTGRFPIRPGDGSGLVIRDGSSSASDWTGDLTPAQYPQSIAPAQGFLASANQDPWDARSARGYLGVLIEPWRAMRINRLLRADSAVTPDAMRRFQTDPGNERAELFVPAFLAAAAQCGGGDRCGTRDASALAEGARLLAQWDRRYTRDNTRAVLFEGAMRELADRTWDELAGPGGERRAVTPPTMMLATLMRDPENAWWDDRRTPAVERRDAILAASLAAAVRETKRRYGAPDAGGWRWDRIRFNNVNHLLRIPALGARELPMQGGPGTLNPSSGTGTHGASWRMVVELGPEVRAWGTYPGGQSGDPTSPGYRDRLDLWVRGELAPLRTPHTAAEAQRIRGSRTVDLAPAAGGARP